MYLIQQTLPVLVGAFLLASTAYGDNAKPQGGVSRDLEKNFQALDRNGDGYVSRDELVGNQALSGGFNKADKDRDGKLDMSEFQALEAGASPDRSLGSVPPQESGGASAGQSAKPERSKQD